MNILSTTIEAMNLPFTISLVTQHIKQVQPILDTVKKTVATELNRIETKFSAFQENSMVSQFQKGNLSAITDAEFQSVYTKVLAAQKETNGLFNPYFDGGYNPTGFVKGWAIQQIFKNFLIPLFRYDTIEAICFNGGGDMQFDTKLGSTFHWQIGIENPYQLNELIAQFKLQKGAIATSGFSKRGNHVFGNSKELSQVTIIGLDIATTDMWATAILSASEKEARQLITEHHLSGVYVTQNQKKFYKHGVFYDETKT